MGQVLVLVVMLWTGAAAQASCTNAIMGLDPCSRMLLELIETIAPVLLQLSRDVQTQPQCLCSLLNNGAGSSLGVIINQTLALSLPSACNVKTTALGQGNAASGPAASSVSAPVGSPAPPAESTTPSDESPKTPNKPPPQTDTPSAGSGSKTVPLTGVATYSGSSTTKLPPHVAVLVLFILSCALPIARF